MSGTVQNIVIAVTGTGIPVVQRNLEDLGKSAKTAGAGVEALKTALEAVGVGLSVAALAEAIDSYTNLNNRLIAVGTSSNDLSAVYEKLKDVSLQTHSSVETTVNLYARMEMGLKSLGYSQNEVIAFTKTLSEAVKLSGASSQEAKYAIQDLAHGISAGSINGRELNGILREMPSLALIIAQAMGVPVGSLKELAAQGKITSDILIQGFKKMSDSVDAQFANRVVTIKDAITDLRTAFTDWVGKFSQTNGVLLGVASGLEALKNNLDTVMKLVLTAGAAFLVWEVIPGVIGMVAAAVEALTVAMLANPILFFAAALAAAATAFDLFKDEIKLGIDDVTTLGDLWRAFLETLGPLFTSLKTYATESLDAIRKGWGETIGNMTTMDWIVVITKGVDILVAALKTSFELIRTGWAVMTQALPELMVGALNMVLSVMGNTVNGILTMLNHLDPLSGDKPANFDFTVSTDSVDGGFKNTIKTAMTAGADARKAFQEALDGKGSLTAGVEGLVGRAQQLGQERMNSKPKDNSNLDAHGTRTMPVDTKGTDKLAKSLEAIENKWNSVLKAVNEYNKAVSTINQAVGAGMISKQQGEDLKGLIKDEEIDKFLGKYDSARKAASDLKEELRTLREAQTAGIITTSQMNDAMAVAKARLQDQIDPVGKLYTEMDHQFQTAKLGSDQQKVANQVFKDQQDLLSKGVILTQSQTAALTAKIQADNEDLKIQTEKNRLIDQFNGPQKELAIGAQAAKQALDEGKISADQYGQAIRNIDLKALLADEGSLSAGVHAGLIQVMNEGSNVAGEMATAMKGAFDGINSAIAQFATTGKINFKSVADSFISSVTQMVLKWAEFQAMKALGVGDMLGGGAAGGAAGGASSAAGGASLTAAGTVLSTAGASLSAAAAALSAAAAASGAAGGAGGASSALGSLGSIGGAADAGGGSSGFGSLFSSGIAALGFAATGAEFQVGGNGGIDSKLVAFRASPDEVVTVRRPDQLDGHASNGPQTAAAPPPQFKIVNSISPQETLDHMNTSGGEQLILNVIQRNPNAIRQATR